MGKTNAIPKGFKQVNTSGDFPAFWIPKKAGDVLTGTVMAKRVVDAKKFGRTNVKKGDTAIVISVADENGELKGFADSHATRQFFEMVRPKQRVFIRFEGIKKFGRKKLKLFTCAVA